ncbi:MAG: hypothetical protein ACRD07_21425 [Acidimicrobiales bacterium]
MELVIVGTAASPWSSAGPTVGRMIRLTREQMREASEAIDRFHQLANVARNTTDLEEHRRLWSEASEIQRQPSAKRPALRDGSIQLKVNLVAFLGNVVQA